MTLPFLKKRKRGQNYFSLSLAFPSLDIPHADRFSFLFHQQIWCRWLTFLVEAIGESIPVLL